MKGVGSPFTRMWMPPETTNSDPISAMKLTYPRGVLQDADVANHGDQAEPDGNLRTVMFPPMLVDERHCRDGEREDHQRIRIHAARRTPHAAVRSH